MAENQNNKKSSIENLKAINELVSSGKVKSLSKNVSELKKSVDGVLTNVREVQKTFHKEEVIQNVEVQTPAPQPVAKAESAPVEKTETVKVEVKTENAPAPKVEGKAEAPKVEAKVEAPKAEAKVEAPKAEVKAEVKPAPKEEAKPAPKAEKAPAPKAEKAHAPKAEAVKTEAVKTEAAKPEVAQPVLFQSTTQEAAAKRALEIQERIRQRMAENAANNPQKPRRFENSNGGGRPQGGYNNNGGGGYNNNRGGYNNNNNNNNGGGFNRGGAPRPQGGYNNNGAGGYNNNRRPQGAAGGFGGKDDDDKKVFAKKVEKKPASPVGIFQKQDTSKNFAKKKDSKQDEKKAMTKRTLIRKGFIVEDGIGADERMGSKKVKTKKRGSGAEHQQFIKIEHAIVTTDTIQIKVLSEKIGIPAVQITKKLFADGIMKTVNESVDFDTAELIAIDYGITLEYKPEQTAEEILTQSFDDTVDTEENLVARPPVVTVMGHVDHGKTSLLDYIRDAKVTLGEAGGITQHIGAYSVDLDGRKITFVDTPGHEAFTAMRKRGADITDIAILVVAADDGLMPQTIEAINHIKAAGVTMIVAMNKIDRPGADTNRIMQQLTEHNVLVESWGGDVAAVPVSAKTGEGIDDLLETILLQADVLELKANPDKAASGSIIEAKLDKGKGPVATILVKSGTLNVGDTVISGFATGRIRAMLDEKGKQVKKAGPSMAVSVLGFKEVPEAGETIMAVPEGKLSKQVINERIAKIKASMIKVDQKVTLEDAFKNVSEGEIQTLNLIIKADVQGSVEAVKQALEKLSTDEVRVRVLHGAVGAINDSDIMLASTSGGIIIGFNVRPDPKTKQTAERDGVEIRTYRIIYDAIEEVKLSMSGMLAPEFKETAIGTIEARTIFKITGVGTVVGGYVIDGKVQRNAKIRLLREGIVIHEGEIDSLKRMKDDVKEVNHGYECGISLKDYQDIKEGDMIEAFIVEEIKRTIK
ncbi:MAG: translation initiation factor IF-2 [Bacillota bacterium]